MRDKIVIVMNVPSRKIREDIEIPVDITVNELIRSVIQIYGLGMDQDNIFNYYLKADNPKALLKGDTTIAEYGLRNGTEIWTWND